MFSHLGATQTLCDLTSVIVCVLFLTQWMVSIISVSPPLPQDPLRLPLGLPLTCGIPWPPSRSLAPGRLLHLPHTSKRSLCCLPLLCRHTTLPWSLNDCLWEQCLPHPGCCTCLVR